MKFFGERLYSGSWDKSLRIHDIFTRKLNAEVLELKAKISNLQIIINANLPGTSENIEDLSKSNILLVIDQDKTNQQF